MFFFTIIPLQKQTNRVISLQKSTKTAIRTSLSIFKTGFSIILPHGGLTQQSTAINGYIKKGNAHLRCNKRKKTYHKIHFGPR